MILPSGPAVGVFEAATIVALATFGVGRTVRALARNRRARSECAPFHLGRGAVRAASAPRSAGERRISPLAAYTKAASRATTSAHAADKMTAASSSGRTAAAA